MKDTGWRKCPICLKYPRVINVEIDSSGGLVPTGYKLWCPRCDLQLFADTEKKLFKKWNILTGQT